MCGRFAMTTDPARLALELDAIDETGDSTTPNYGDPNYGAPNYGAPNYGAPNYNVAPTTPIAAVVDREDHRRIRLMRWGLLPTWVKRGPDGGPPTRGPQLINARAETVTTSSAFRSAAAHKRCLIPMDGYYEWRPNTDDPKRGRKTPFYFHRPDGKPLLVAGLWSAWRPDPTAEPLLTCTVITTDAVGGFARVHDRMPLILAEADWDRWLDPDAPAPQDLLAAPPDTAPMAMREVSTLVNRVANNGPELIEPAGPGNQPVGLF
ncbi:MAG TPA: SOS response-associated peptidase [Mycobacterium sp.]|nr:SOS response-associated peptidase [Mycobacterium sp.]